MPDRLLLLRQVPLLSSLPPQELESLAAMLIERQFEPREEIVSEGDEPRYLGIVRTGRVKVIKHSASGKDTTVAALESGEVFGEVSLFTGRTYAATVMAMTPCSVFLMQRADVVALVGRHPELAMRLIGALSRRLRYTQEMLQSMATERVEKRVAHLLLRLSEEFGVKMNDRVLINMPLTRRELAEMVGTTIETTIRVLSRLTKEGYLRTVPGRLYPRGCHQCGGDTLCHRCHKIVLLRPSELMKGLDGQSDNE